MQLFSALYDEDTINKVVRDQTREQAMFSVQDVRAAFGAHYYEYGRSVDELISPLFAASLSRR